MQIEFTRPTIYVSHPIRGTSGNIKENCEKVAKAARRLRRVFPEIDFYVPAEHDLTLQILTAEEILTIDDVMFADLAILESCHGWMYYKFEDSSGSEIEKLKAIDMGITSDDLDVFTYDIEKLTYQKLRKDFNSLVTRTIDEFYSRRYQS